MVKTTRLKNSCTKATLKQTIAELTNDKIFADKLIYKMKQTIVNQMTLMTEMDRKHASVRKMDAFVHKTKDEEIARVRAAHMQTQEYMAAVHIQSMQCASCTDYHWVECIECEKLHHIPMVYRGPTPQ